jgi:predicted nucleic acid-binding protein
MYLLDTFVVPEARRRTPEAVAWLRASRSGLHLADRCVAQQAAHAAARSPVFIRARNAAVSRSRRSHSERYQAIRGAT